MIDQESRPDEAPTAFVEPGITGATLLDGGGTGRALRCVLDDSKADAAIQMIQDIHDVCGNLAASGAGSVFIVPVGRAVAPALELER